MTEQKPLKLEVGKTYLSRDGVKVKIVDMRVHSTHRYTAENGCHYAVDGNFYGECSEFDLIEECKPDEQKLSNPPAFPTTPVRVNGVLDVDCYQGMNLRDYFIAHAPAEPQPWFVPNMSPKPELPNPDKELSPEDAREWRRLDEYAEQDGNERVKAFCRRQTDAYNARLAWEKEQTKQRYVQWPAAWADAMLRARAA